MYGQKILLGLCVTALFVNANAQTNTFPTSGNVGIGTPSPYYPLTVQTTEAWSGISLYNGSSQVAFIVNDGSGGTQFGMQNTNGTRNVQFMTEGSSFFNGGNVGIGTKAPAYTLDVAGTIHASTAIIFPDGTSQSSAFNSTLCGGDYAETVDVTGDRKNYEPGDVLVIGAESGSDVVKSAEPYSTLVVGVYSTKPGVVGRRQSTDAKVSTTEVPMAMVGIAPTKVSAENGPIRRGDLLVTSSTRGYAMKGTDRSRMFGAVIGKALGSLDSGKGVIEVVVTLQ